MHFRAFVLFMFKERKSMKKVIFQEREWKLIRTVGATAVIEDEEERLMVPASAVKEVKEAPKKRKTAKKKGSSK